MCVIFRRNGRWTIMILLYYAVMTRFISMYTNRFYALCHARVQSYNRFLPYGLKSKNLTRQMSDHTTHEILLRRARQNVNSKIDFEARRGRRRIGNSYSPVFGHRTRRLVILRANARWFDVYHALCSFYYSLFLPGPVKEKQNGLSLARGSESASAIENLKFRWPDGPGDCDQRARVFTEWAFSQKTRRLYPVVHMPLLRVPCVCCDGVGGLTAKNITGCVGRSSAMLDSVDRSDRSRGGGGYIITLQQCTGWSLYGDDHRAQGAGNALPSCQRIFRARIKRLTRGEKYSRPEFRIIVAGNLLFSCYF